MAQAAILLVGLGALWALLVQRATTPQDWIFTVLAAVFCVALSARCVVGQERARLGAALKTLTVFVARSGKAWGDAALVMRAALSADIKLRPSLVRVRLRGAAEASHAAFANLVTAAPGAAAVELDADGLLVHVLQEDSIDARELGRLESRLLSRADQPEASR